MTDYKILTKALANRIQRVLSLIVLFDKTTSVKGRMINDNVRLLHDSVYYANEYNIPPTFITIDNLKAYGRVSHGPRQGCAFSMPLYVLVAETMAINIRAKPNIHRLRPPGSGAKVKLSQFADDTTLLLTDDQFIDETFCTFDLYECFGGKNQSK